MNYTDKLKLPQWQKRRLEIMQRDKFCCVKCKNDSLQIEVHHKDYWLDKNPWEYPDTDLISLCASCHNKEFKREKHENFLVLSLRNKGFYADEVLAMSCFIDKYDSFCTHLKKLIHNYHNFK